MAAVETTGRQCSVDFRNGEAMYKAASVFKGSQINEKETKEYDIPP